MLPTELGANVSPRTGLTALLTAGMPLLMAGVSYWMLWALKVSALGIRLNALSKEKGTTSRRATIPHKRTAIHFGAFFNRNRSSTTASQLAAMLMFRMFRNRSLISFTCPVDQRTNLGDFLGCQLLFTGKCG